jgi:rare lipoprotein A
LLLGFWYWIFGFETPFFFGYIGFLIDSDMKFVLPFLICTVLSGGISAQEFGLASYYSDQYHGTPTAYGEKYDKNAFTAAHKKHPLGTRLRVTRLDNRLSVVVRVNDRGPYIKGRIVDLSRAAAEKLDLIKDGKAQVQVDVLPGPAETEDASTTSSTTNSAAASDVADPDNNEPSENEERVNTSPIPVNQRIDRQNATPYGLYKVTIQREQNTGFGVQVASMMDYLNALQMVGQLRAAYFDNILVSVERQETGGTVYKVILGPFETRDQAESYNNSLQKKYNRNGFVVDFSEIDY